MTAAAAKAASRADRNLAWPAPDTPVLRARPLQAGTGPHGLPRFADATWHLQAAHPDLHAVAATLCWDRFPEPLTHAFKAFALAALDHPYPVDPTVGRCGERPAVTTIALWVRDLRVFACWLADRGITRLCDVTPTDLDGYHRHVTALACSPDRQGRLLAAVRTLWSYRIHLPQPARLLPDPWDGTGGSRMAGRSWSPASKTPRISAATMETLLAWSLTMVEHIGRRHHRRAQPLPAPERRDASGTSRPRPPRPHQPRPRIRRPGPPRRHGAARTPQGQR